MWEVWITNTILILQSWPLITSDISKYHLITNIFIILIILDPRNELAINDNSVILMLSDTFLDHVFNKSIIWLDLLVDNTILHKECTNDIPLVIYIVSEPSFLTTVEIM